MKRLIVITAIVSLSLLANWSSGKAERSRAQLEDLRYHCEPAFSRMKFQFNGAFEYREQHSEQGLVIDLPNTSVARTLGAARLKFHSGNVSTVTIDRVHGGLVVKIQFRGDASYEFGANQSTGILNLTIARRKPEDLSAVANNFAATASKKIRTAQDSSIAAQPAQLQLASVEESAAKQTDARDKHSKTMLVIFVVLIVFVVGTGLIVVGRGIRARHLFPSELAFELENRETMAADPVDSEISPAPVEESLQCDDGVPADDVRMNWARTYGRGIGEIELANRLSKQSAERRREWKGAPAGKRARRSSSSSTRHTMAEGESDLRHRLDVLARKHRINQEVIS